jgi:hypothetical protein
MSSTAKRTTSSSGDLISVIARPEFEIESTGARAETPISPHIHAQTYTYVRHISMPAFGPWICAYYYRARRMKTVLQSLLSSTGGPGDFHRGPENILLVNPYVTAQIPMAFTIIWQ